MPQRRDPERDNRGLIAELRTRIAAIEGARPGPAGKVEALPLAAEIDAALPWGGLRLAALHEVVAADAGAGAGFAAVLLARLSARGGTSLWCLPGRSASESGGLYGPGLLAFGLEPERLIVVRPRSDRESLWAMEEGLRSSSLAAVLGEVAKLDLTSSRRLQLAAEQGGTTALLLRPREAEPGPSAAFTRWRLSAAPSAAGAQEGERLGVIGTVRWRAELLRCRGGAPSSWMIEWHNETGDFTGDFTVVPDLPHRPAEPAAGAGEATHRTG